MKPYYKNELTTIYNGDCLEVLKTMTDNSVDLILTDPPYGIKESGKNNNRGTKKIPSTKFIDYNWDCFTPSKEHFDEMLRVGKKVIIFGGNYFIEHLNNSSCWLVWDKNNFGNDFADCELAWTNFKTAVRKYKFTWNGMLQEDMKHKEQRYHPTQKPIELFVDILKDYNKDNGLVMDCFAGSFTTAIACEKLGMKNISVEKQKEYCDIGVERLNKLQMRLDI